MPIELLRRQLLEVAGVTTRYKRGDIVLASFPFTDLSSSKRRPALVVSPDSSNETMQQDLVLAAITSQGADDGALMINRL